MKNLILFIVLLASMQSLFAQSSCIPNYIHLNAVARNTDGTAVVSKAIDVQIEFFSGSPTQNSTPIYCELAINIKTNTVGEFALEFGNPDYFCTQTALNNVDWLKCNSGNLYYRLSWRITGQQTLTPIATGLFTSVPYAFAARTAEKVKSIPYATQSYGDGWLASNRANVWESITALQVLVPEAGTYLLTADTGIFSSSSPINGQGRVVLLENGLYVRTITEFGIGFIPAVGGGGHYGSVSRIVTLPGNKIIRLEVSNSMVGTWNYGGDAGHPSYLNIVKLSD